MKTLLTLLAVVALVLVIALNVSAVESDLVFQDLSSLEEATDAELFGDEGTVILWNELTSEEWFVAVNEGLVQADLGHLQLDASEFLTNGE